jgi:hypothetical protein
MTGDKEMRARFERTSFGTANARAARRSVSATAAQRVVARSAVSGRFVSNNPKKKPTKSGG